MRAEWSASSIFARQVIRPSCMIAESRRLESLSVADDGMFYDSDGDGESGGLPGTVRRIIESGPDSRVDDVQEVPNTPALRFAQPVF